MRSYYPNIYTTSGSLGNIINKLLIQNQIRSCNINIISCLVKHEVINNFWWIGRISVRSPGKWLDKSIKMVFFFTLKISLYIFFFLIISYLPHYKEYCCHSCYSIPLQSYGRIFPDTKSFNFTYIFICKINTTCIGYLPIYNCNLLMVSVVKCQVYNSLIYWSKLAYLNTVFLKILSG